MKSGIQNTYISIQIIRINIFVLYFIYVRYTWDEVMKIAKMRRVIYDINSIEQEIGSNKLFETGDFNEWPEGGVKCRCFMACQYKCSTSTRK